MAPSTRAGWWSVTSMLIALLLLLSVVMAMNMPYNLPFPAPRMEALLAALTAATFAGIGTVCGAIALIQKDRGKLLIISEVLGILFFQQYFLL